MGQIETTERDFLDVLRVLNVENINNNFKLCDDLFDLLFKNLYTGKRYIEGLTKDYSDSLHKPMIAGGFDELQASFDVNTRVSREIKLRLIVGDLVDKDGSLDFGVEVGANDVFVAGMLMTVHDAVKKCSRNFRNFKSYFLQGLIAFHAKEVFRAKEVFSPEETARLNKVILIYVEHCFDMPLLEPMPYILDDEFFKDLCELFRNSGINFEDSAFHSLALKVWFRYENRVNGKKTDRTARKK